MYCSKSLAITALLMIASTVFAADVLKTTQIAQFSGVNLPDTRIRFATKGTAIDLVREILNQVKIPTGSEIKLINLGNGIILPITQDSTYDVDTSSYQPNRVVVFVERPSLEDTGMGVVLIRDELLDSKMALAIPKSGKIIDIVNAYGQEVTIPKNKKIIMFRKHSNGIIMQGNDSYTIENLGAEGIIPIYETIPYSSSIDLPSSASLPVWYQAPRKSDYFMNRYEHVVSAYNGNDSQAYAEFKNTATYVYLNSIINQMNGTTKPFVVVERLLNRMTASGGSLLPDTDLLMALVKPPLLRAIIAMHVKNGNRAIDEDEYKKIPSAVDPFLKRIALNTRGGEMDMTIYGFFMQIINGLDDVVIEYNSPIYFVCDQLDKSLTEIEIKVRQ